MISEKGYGHTIKDVEKMVKAGVIICRHIYKEEIQNYERIKEDNEAILELLKAIVAKGENIHTRTGWMTEWANAKELIEKSSSSTLVATK